MHDHNLDDLIIHDIPPVNKSKSKSLLTIIALLIIVLVVAAFLIQTLFSTPDGNDIVVDESASYRSSELELQTPDKKSQTKPKAPVKTNKNVSKTESIKESTISVDEQAKKVPAKPNKPAAKRPTQKASPLPTTKPVAPKKPKAKEPATRKPAEARTKPSTKPATTITEQEYFVQVGSFSKDPSARFLSVIKNSGFDYKIVDNSISGTKKLLIGPYQGRQAVDTALIKVRDRISKSAFVTQE